MPAVLSPYLMPIALLLGSNMFMTAAWYWHLKYKEVPPANRFGSDVYSAAQLKTIQEVITLLVFAAFSTFYLKEALTWSQGFGFLLISAGSFFVFHKL
jgi:uncharacterized protein (DUF486 family)